MDIFLPDPTVLVIYKCIDLPSLPSLKQIMCSGDYISTLKHFIVFYAIFTTTNLMKKQLLVYI